LAFGLRVSRALRLSAQRSSFWPRPLSSPGPGFEGKLSRKRIDKVHPFECAALGKVLAEDDPDLIEPCGRLYLSVVVRQVVRPHAAHRFLHHHDGCVQNVPTRDQVVDLLLRLLMRQH